MKSRQRNITATITAAILVLALGLAGTFAASGSDESDGGFGDEVETGMFLHDDFSTAFTGSIRDRDVYVENTGDTSLYVRMRLDEYMKYGGRSLVAGAKQEDKATWTAHIPAGKDVADCTTGIHDFFTIQMGNDMAVKYKPKTKNAYNPALTDADKTKTTPTAEVVLIEDYLKAKAKPASCWILDNKDGYAYWHTQLKKDSATGLVLNSITDTGLIDESYYYGINAKAEAVTEADLNAWFNGTTTTDGDKASNRASENAVKLLKGMSPKYTEITEEMKNNGAADYDSDNDGFLTKKENAQYEAEKGVTSTPTPEDPDKEKPEISGDNFPDSALLGAIQDKDTNGDGKLSKEEIEAITSLDLSGKTISDYTGLELLTSLTDLNVSNSGLTEVTFLSKTPNLEKLNVSNNKLTGIDVSDVPKLTTLTAGNQAASTALTYSEATNTYNSAASAYKSGTTFTGTDVALQGDGSIRVSNMAENKTNAYSYPVTVNGSNASLSGTVTLTTDTSNWKALNSANFPVSALLNVAKTKDLNVDNKLSEEEVYKATSLNLSGKTITDYTGLEVFKKLTTLDVSSSNLTTVNFLSRTPNLTTLDVSNNQLTSLSLAKGALTTILEAVTEERAATQLTNVNCSNNRLTGLDLSSAPGLTTLNCSNNQITKLDISSNAPLTNITATGQATTVNVTYDTTAKKYKGGSSLFAAETTFGASDAAYDSATGGLTLTTLTTGKTSTYSLPLKYNNSQKGTLSGTVTFTGTIHVPNAVKEAVEATAVGGTVQIANKDGSKTEWIVYNKTASEADLITKNTVGKRQYHTSRPYPGWLNSDIRKWLNNGTSGYKSQLSNEMQAAIKPQNLTTATAFDNWTPVSSTDEIYLLTETGQGSGKVGKTIGASLTLTTEQLNEDISWWLRSPGSHQNAAKLIDAQFNSTNNGYSDKSYGVRPAMTLSLK